MNKVFIIYKFWVILKESNMCNTQSIALKMASFECYIDRPTVAYLFATSNIV